MNRKFYNFTDRQRRRDRSLKYAGMWRSVPKHYRKWFNKEYNAKSKVVLHKLMLGQEVEFPRFVRDAAWYYW